MQGNICSSEGLCESHSDQTDLWSPMLSIVAEILDGEHNSKKITD